MKVSADMIREILHYDPESGIFTWNGRSFHCFKTVRACNTWNSRFAGKRAGSIDENKAGYKRRRIKVLGSMMLEHHLAYLYMNGHFPPGEIDHKNRDATDNRWANLRVVTRAENMRNKSMRSNNTSGVTGVSWNNRDQKWHARCAVNGHEQCLGYFDELDEAAMEVMEFRSENGFDPRHGMELAHYRAGVANAETT